MVDNTIVSRLRPRWDTLVNSMRQNLGTSVVRNAMSVPSKEQLERARILNIRKSDANRKMMQAREA